MTQRATDGRRDGVKKRALRSVGVWQRRHDDVAGAGDILQTSAATECVFDLLVRAAAGENRPKLLRRDQPFPGAFSRARDRARQHDTVVPLAARLPELV